jgi:hypothetical protein
MNAVIERWCDVPARAARPNADLQPATSATRAPRVRDPLQRTQAASRHRERPATRAATRTESPIRTGSPA